MKSRSSLLLNIAWLICGVTPSVPLAQEHRLLLEVKALDEQNKGVMADVVRIFSAGQEEWLAKTNERGTAKFNPPVPCSFNHRILVRPEAPLRYQKPEFQTCGRTLLFVLRRWVDIKQAIAGARDQREIENIIERAEALEGTEAFGSLALIYTELSSRVSPVNANLADQIRERAYLYAGKFLNVEGALTFDSMQSKSVMSKQLKAALMNFQKEKSVIASGELNSATLQAMAGGPHWFFLYGPPPPGIDGIGGPSVKGDPWVATEAEKVVKNLAKNAEMAVAKNDYALAALLYTETARRLTVIDHIGEAREAEKQSYEFAGKALEVRVATTYDPIQDRWVMSDDLQRAVKEYQARQGLPGSGQLNYRTLRALSDKNITPYLYRVF